MNDQLRASVPFFFSGGRVGGGTWFNSSWRLGETQSRSERFGEEKNLVPGDSTNSMVVQSLYQ
jgi:hypothetical protein